MKTKAIKQIMVTVVAIMALLPIRSVAASATLSIEDFTIQQGETKEMLIDVNNANMQVTMVEFYMRLPSGLSVATENGELAVDIAGRTTWKKHSLEVNITDGTVHFFLYSGSNAVLTGTSGAVISVKLTASSPFTGGNIVFERQIITSPDETECKPNNFIYAEDIISFADADVKAICVANWDTNGDGELSKTEAAAVTDLGTVFRSNINIYTFKELRYFNGLTSIGDNAFYYCRDLTSITIPNSVTSIGSSAFYACGGLTSITIPNSVTNIGSSAFEDCGGLTFITIPNSVTSIGSSAFEDCDGLNSITIGNSVTNIGNNAFRYCSSLTNITIPNYVTSIGDMAFYGCSGLTSITIPNSVTSIGNWAFEGCSGLTYVEFHCEEIESWFRDNTSIKEVIIGDEVTSISQSAFSGCSGLTSITIPNSVTSIGNWAFEGCI